MPKADTIIRASSQTEPAVVPQGFATSGWVVEVLMPEWPLDRRFLAVGIKHPADAEATALLHPGILPSDQRIARRCLSPTELANLKLRAGAVRPYGWILGT
jgi:hypothetical protein